MSQSSTKNYVVLCVVGAAISTALVARASAGFTWENAEAAGFFALIGLAAQALAHRLPKGVSGSIGFIPFMSAMLVAPSLPLVLAVGLAMLAAEVLQHQAALKATFNVAQYVLATSVAVLVFDAFGGVPITTHHRPRRHTKTDLVILCDVSESVTSFAHFTLLLIFALREQFSRVRAFAFVDELDEITRFFAPGSDVLDAVTRLVDEARVTWLFGRTDYGRAFELFEQRYPDAIGRRASLLVLGDARSNYTDPGLAALTRLAGQARHAHWLNPERRQTWDTGDSVAEKFARIVPMVECRNLDQLGQFVRDLA